MSREASGDSPPKRNALCDHIERTTRERLAAELAACRARRDEGDVTAVRADEIKEVRKWLVSGRAIHEQWAAYLASDPVARGELSQSAADELGNTAWHQERVLGYTRAIRLLDALWIATPGDEAVEETWNTCPDCGKRWKDEQPTLGLVHRTRPCERCASDARRDRHAGRRWQGDTLMLHLLNTTIIPAGCDGLFSVRTISLSTAQNIFHEAMGHDGQAFSHVGHEATAALMSEALGFSIAADRTPWDGSGTALVLQLAGRPPEGKVLSVAEMEAAGYTWRLLKREASLG